MSRYSGRCPITGITERALLRASHIVPWAECSDAQRLDVHNGLLLSALWDAAFDRGLISFADDGAVLVGPQISEIARQALGIASAPRLQPSALTTIVDIDRSCPDAKLGWCRIDAKSKKTIAQPTPGSLLDIAPWRDPVKPPRLTGRYSKIQIAAVREVAGGFEV